WNIQNIHPHDPVGLGLCKQVELDEAVQLAAARRAKSGEAVEVAAEDQPTEEPVVADAEPTEAPTENAADEASGEDVLEAAQALFNKTES
ncbi:MAG: cell cycle transcriptional regulator TrcR, partial [Kordiimonas sp.]